MAATSQPSAPPAAQPLIALQGVSVAQAEHVVVTDVHLHVNSGEFVYLIGKTGSGKSSLLRALYGDLPLQAGTGRVCDVDLNTVNRRNVHRLRRLIGIVFQDFALLPDRTVHANLDFVLRATGWKDVTAIDQRIADCLKAVGLGAKGYKMPHQLSGGEQQRVAIARALLNSPALILADEPTGNLDPETTEEILSLLHGLVRENRSVLMATHDHDALRRHPGRLIRCEQGRIEEEDVVGWSPRADHPAPEPAPLGTGKPISHASPLADLVREVVQPPVPDAPPVVPPDDRAEEEDDDVRYQWDDQDDEWWENLPGASAEPLENLQDTDMNVQGEQATPAVDGAHENAMEGRPNHVENSDDPPGRQQDSESTDGPSSPPSAAGGLPPGIQFRLNR